MIQRLARKPLQIVDRIGMAIELVQRHAPGASEAVFSRNARRLYGLDLATPEGESA